MKKRSNGEGSFRRLPSGNWRGQLMDGYTSEGKKNIINVTAPTKAEAQQKLRQYLHDKETGVLLANKNMPFSKWSSTWYEDFKGQVQDSTYANYKYTLKVLNACFGDRCLTEIKQIDVNRFLSDLKKTGCSASKINKCKAMLVQIFSAAEDNDLIVKNPALRAKVLRDPNAKILGGKRKDAFSQEEVDLLMQFLPHDRLGHSIRTLLASGIRTQELLALTPEDIEPDGSVIHISKAVKMVDGIPRLGPPKSKRSVRDVPIPARYRKYVAELRAMGNGAFLWTSYRSESLLYCIGSFRKKYYRAIADIPDIRKLPPHCCRHTYITLLQARGVPMEMIARLVGHSNITTTDGYTHTSLNTLANAVSALDDKVREV